MKQTLYITLCFFLMITSCKKDPEIKDQKSNLSINFTHTVNQIDLITGDGCSLGGECLPDHSCCMGGSLLPYTNDSGQHYNVQRLNYLISDITLHDDEGHAILLKEVHFVDVDDLSTLMIDIGELENGNYTSISFTMGLDTSKNKPDYYINEDFHSTMWWPLIGMNGMDMGGGYHYMKLEGDYDTITKGYATHTGGTMGMDHSFNNNLGISLGINSEVGDAIININMEINNWYQNPHTINLAPAIMADMAKQMKLQSNGSSDVFSVESHVNK